MLDVDDGERVIITDKIYGALLITTIRALESASTFNEENIPNLEFCLKLVKHLIAIEESPAYAAAAIDAKGTEVVISGHRDL